MSNSQLIKEIILERNPEAIFLENSFDEAILGYGISCGQNYIAIYDSDKCLKTIMKVLEMGEIEAYEQLQYSIDILESSENNPIIFSDFSKTKPPKFSDIDISDQFDGII